MNAQKAPNGNSVYFWYQIGDVLDVKEEYDVNDILNDNNLSAHPNFKFANKALFKLFTVIRKIRPSVIIWKQVQNLIKY